ncbi:hypothetical protein D6D12_09407 [Aureobasidium pullulans]|uniref:Altered inheritance of mitochondria protein 41 n=1 Tax=Aureobasidium pullulans TaxID=5580 RepID=A0AB74JG25_AURPU|nr:hypothetical protein D6D12_09407 [Aureobasidium pullulans]THX55792.1 hypothetical protein D6D11_03723 [Aureobasidium pullulans]
MLSLARRHNNDAAPRLERLVALLYDVQIRAKVTRIVKEKMQGLAAGAIIAEAVVAEPKAETETTTTKAKAETETTTTKAKAETEVIIAKAKAETEVIIAKAKVETEPIITKAKAETQSDFKDVASKRLFGILKAAMETRVQWVVSPMKKSRWLRNNARTKM